MLFVILGFDGPDGGAKRPIHRPAQLANLDRLYREERLILAGPLTDGTGSLVVVGADSMEEARTLASQDPYTIHGVFDRVEIHPFTQVFPHQSS